MSFQPKEISTPVGFTPAQAKKKRRESGNALLEFTFLTPWVFFLFVGVLDFGFFANSLIATENAVRAAGLYYVGSQQQPGDVTQACYYALEVLREQPNVKGNVTTCLTTTSVTQTNPVALFASSPSSGPDGEPSVTVTIVYATVPMIPIPGVLSGQLNISRTVQFKQQNNHA